MKVQVSVAAFADMHLLRKTKLAVQCGLGCRQVPQRTGPYDFIAVVTGANLDAIGTLVTDDIGTIDGVTRTTTCVAVSLG